MGYSFASGMTITIKDGDCSHGPLARYVRPYGAGKSSALSPWSVSVLWSCICQRLCLIGRNHLLHKCVLDRGIDPTRVVEDSKLR